jgi:hypothetical protein
LTATFVKLPFLIFIHLIDKIEKNEMGGTCSADRRGEAYKFCWGKRPLGDPGVDGRIILR